MLEHFLMIKTSDRPDGPASSGTTSSRESRMAEPPRPEAVIADMGYRVVTVREEKRGKELAERSDAVILAVPSSELELWAKRVMAWRDWPVLWWCEEASVTEDCYGNLDVDGILFPGMSHAQMNWTLMLSSSHHLRRTQWQKEREQLLARLEERKWIERAKAILCEMKNISEAEAYEFLRTQAMKDRKRVVDVASSIVKVYQWITDNKGEKRL